MNDYMNEIKKICSCLNNANLIDRIRHEVSAVMKDKRASIINGEFSDDKYASYDVVISHTEGKEINKDIKRRLASLKNVQIDEFDGLVDNVIGVRRMRGKK